MTKIITKTILLCAICVLSFTKVNAQYVTIPDANFRGELMWKFPTCFNANQQLDTNCASQVPGYVYPISSNITNLSGIQYFHNLDSLSIDGNWGLTSLPPLPSSIKYLTTESTGITILSNLPISLKYLRCGNSALTSITSLPPNLETLYCQYASSGFNLPALPNSLKTLDASNNSFYVVYLPPAMKNFYCKNCSMIDFYPTQQLISLDVSNNFLLELNNLPTTLTYLDCSNNFINCFSSFPTSLSGTGSINITNNPATCLPNYVSGMNAATLAMPLCQQNNVNSCPTAEAITGKVYFDNNNNCLLDGADNAAKNIHLKFFNPITNQFGSTYTLQNGTYSFPTPSGTNFILVDTINKPYTIACTHPGADTTITTNTSAPLVNNVNFSLSCQQGTDSVYLSDIGIQSIVTNGVVFPGQPLSLQVLAGDLSQWFGLSCSNSISGQLQIVVDGPFTFSGVPLGALTPTISGNVYTYNISNFGSISNENAFKLLFTTNTNAQSFQYLCVNASVTFNSTDINTTNNTMYSCFRVVNSFDPNYKEVYPVDVLPGFQDWLTYTVHFQNTGTAPAINIQIQDTINTNLDEQTFEVISYSHYNETTLQNHVVSFKFPNIQLVDSTTNAAASQGFIQYRIKPKANLPVGTQITNTAHIYFDFNAPIATNTTVNNFTTTVGVAESQSNSPALNIYPNPANRSITLKTSNPTTVTIVNLLGDEMMNIKVQNQTTIDISSYAKGIYFVKTGNGKTMKLIKE